MTDDVGAMRGEMTNLGDGIVDFGIDPEARALLMRLPLSALGGPAARFVAAVGSNGQWNDDLPNTGSFTVAD